MSYGGNQHVNKYLTNLSVAYTNKEYIADQVFRSDVAVSKESDQWVTYNIERRYENTLRPNKAPANAATWGVSYTSYSLEEHAIKDLVSDRDRANADQPINVDVDTTEFLTDAIMLRLEKQASDLFFTTTNWSNNGTLTTATSWWGNTTTAVSPMIQVMSATSAIVRAAGLKPNTLILGWQTYEGLKNNSAIYSRVQYVERAIVTPELLAAVFDVERVLVGAASYNNMQEGHAFSGTFIWGPDAWLGFMAQTPGRKMANAAARLRMTDGGSPYKVKKWRDDELAGDYIEVSTMCKPVAVATLAGYLFKSAGLV